MRSMRHHEVSVIRVPKHVCSYKKKPICRNVQGDLSAGNRMWTSKRCVCVCMCVFVCVCVAIHVVSP